MYVFVFIPEDQSRLFNINCRNEVLLYQIKKRCKMDRDGESNLEVAYKIRVINLFFPICPLNVFCDYVTINLYEWTWVCYKDALESNPDRIDERSDEMTIQPALQRRTVTREQQYTLINSNDQSWKHRVFKKG